MWNIIGANRLLQQKARKTQYLKHRKTLAEIKPQIDNLPPPQFQFLTSRPKAKQKASQINMTVQENNRDLVRRMMRPKSGVKSVGRQFQKASLQSTYLKFKAAQIDEQNQKLLLRLKDTTSCLNFNRFQEEHKKHLGWKFSHRRASVEAKNIRPLSAR